MIQQYKQNRTFQNNDSKFYQQVNGESMKKIEQPDANETKQFLNTL